MIFPSFDSLISCVAEACFDSWYDESQASLRESLRKTSVVIGSHCLTAEFLHCVYSSLRESATTFAVGTFRLVGGGDLFCLLLLGTVLSTRRLRLHAFEHTPLFSNVEEEFGNRSSFELPKANMAYADAYFGSR